MNNMKILAIDVSRVPRRLCQRQPPVIDSRIFIAGYHERDGNPQFLKDVEADYRLHRAASDENDRSLARHFTVLPEASACRTNSRTRTTPTPKFPSEAGLLPSRMAVIKALF